MHPHADIERVRTKELEKWRGNEKEMSKYREHSALTLRLNFFRRHDPIIVGKIVIFELARLGE